MSREFRNIKFNQSIRVFHLVRSLPKGYILLEIVKMPIIGALRYMNETQNKTITTKITAILRSERRFNSIVVFSDKQTFFLLFPL